MIIDKELILRVGESREQYLVRIASQRQKYNLTWQSVADICNDQLGLDHAESTYRKKYAAFEQLFTATGGSDNAKVLEEIQEATRELYRERIKVRDERNEYNRKLREEARRENILDTLVKAIDEHIPMLYTPPLWSYTHTDNDSTVVVMISDMHCGMEVANAQTEFSVHVLSKMLNDYLKQIRSIRDRYNSADCHVLLGGDLIAGIIHSSIRFESSQNVIEQVMTASDLLAYFIRELADRFNSVYVHSVVGNHGRVSPKKGDDVRGENFDALIPYYLRNALANIDTVHIMPAVDPALDIFEIQGKRCGLVHGDKDKITTIGADLVPFAGELDYIFMGHVHTTGMYPMKGMGKVIVNGSFVASDTYAFDNRYFSDAEQVVMVINKNEPDSLCRCRLKGGDENESI